MTIGLQPDAMKPGIHCVYALDPGFHGVQMVRRMRTVMLIVPVCPESGFLGPAARPRPTSRVGAFGLKPALSLRLAE
jgi:hypothetical protein